MKKLLIGLCLTLVFALVFAPNLLTSFAKAHEIKAGDITINHPWARASATSTAKTGIVFFGLHNMGHANDTLVRATTPVAKRTEIHTHKMDDTGMMKMYPYGELLIPAKGTVDLKPGGLHLMLIKLKAPLVEGEIFSLTLTFEIAGDVMVDVIVDAVGAIDATEHARHGKSMEGIEHGNMSN